MPRLEFDFRPELGIVIASTLIFGWVWSRWRRRAKNRAHTRRSRRLGVRGERGAERLLNAAGYRVVDVQPTATVRVEVDGVIEQFTVQGDFLVKRWRRTYLAEVKGGPDVSRLGHRGTRRQLLEYACAFDVHGVLLVDMHRKVVQKVRFPALYSRHA